jgi:putative flippase GtrA
LGSLILGCRRFCGEVPKRSRFGNTVTRFVYRTVTGLDVSDTQTGLRAFNASLIPFMLEVKGDRYEYEMNVLLKCARSRVPIREIEIATIYFDNNEGSHFSTLKDSFIIYRDIIKFAASSLTGFAVDYGLYSLLVLVTGGLGSAVSIPLSNITARIVSSSVNYSINRRFVFKNTDSAVKTAAQYFALAACILAGNTVLLSFLVNGLGANEYAAKIITEITFFVASYFAQRFFIFAKKPKNSGAQSMVKTN